MVEPGELMIGNLILGIYEDDDDNETSEIVKVVCIDPTKEITEYEIWVDGTRDQYDDFAPIPLTEEWLIKCNVIKRSVYGTTFIARIVDNIGIPDYIKAVHELQNWYYWEFEKTELKIKK